MRAVLFSVLSAALAALAPAAQAGEGTSTTYLNVRSGAGGGNPVIGGLNPGDVVEILRCDANAWCQIVGAGQDGWVASRYLTAGPLYPALNQGCRWDLDTTLPDPVFKATCPPGVEPPPPPPPPGDLACLFERENYGGERTCLEVGDHATLDPGLNDSFSSVQLTGEARLRLCTDPDLGGTCMDWLDSATELDRRLDDTASSVKVYVGYLPPPPPPPPVVHRAGAVSVALNGRANLDTGTEGPAGADIWWRRVDATTRALVPVNGAQLSLGDGSDRNLHACRAERFDEKPLPPEALEGGAVVCIKTNMGRVGRFQLTESAASGIALDYVTWGEE